MSKDTPGGYNGKILRVNLTDGSTSVEELDPLFNVQVVQDSAGEPTGATICSYSAAA